jgi:hypothetical protein
MAINKKADDGKISKADAVRAALKAGHDKPQDASAYIKETYGLDVAPQVVSTYKSIDNKRKGKGKKRGRKPSATASAVPGPMASSKSGHLANPADLARGVKSLVETYGADAVRDMAGVFAG